MPHEKGIIFSDWAIPLIRSGRKTQTRRTIKDDWWRCLDPDNPEDLEKAVKSCWYGPVGRRLYVKEAWAENDSPSGYIYRSDDPYDHRVEWRNPMFMPREAARTFLDVTEIRIQRLHDISEEDANAEGMTIH